MTDHYAILRRPLMTEKSLHASDAGQYAFEVEMGATKIQIRQAVEKLFDVRVVSVSTAIQRGKKKRVGRRVGKRPNWKKAVVRLQEGQSIEFFQGA